MKPRYEFFLNMGLCGSAQIIHSCSLPCWPTVVTSLALMSIQAAVLKAGKGNKVEK